MPNGNVGTPLSVFMDLIRSCRFPPRMISKLNLDFPKSRSSRKYGALGYNYSKKEAIDLHDEQADTIETNARRNSNEQTQSDDEMPHEWQNTDDDHVSLKFDLDYLQLLILLIGYCITWHIYRTLMLKNGIDMKLYLMMLISR